MADIILTGDRPTGPLHLGHYIGSLKNRVQLQHAYQQFIMIADVQALTDNFENPAKIKDNIYEVVKDYLASGIDPNKTTIFLQSQIPEIAELTLYYMNLVTVGRLERNPTVKNEMQLRGYTKSFSTSSNNTGNKDNNDSIPVGFFCYPINQAADTTIFKATVVPVGDDQIPMIEQTNEIVRKFNRIYHTDCLKECKQYLSTHPRLSGIDGQAKASKSLGNAIYLCDGEQEIKTKVYKMFTDPEHLNISDPGKVEGNVVFEYLDAFHTNKDEINELKHAYRKGGLGDVMIKQILNNTLQELIAPIRTKRNLITDQEIQNIIIDGTQKARKIAQQTIREIKSILCIDIFQ